MVHSMTGFGRGEAANESYKITIEMKSVNHRYLDISIRMPHKFGFYENQIRSLTREYASRGKVDVFVTVESLGDSDADITYNRAVAGAYIEGVRQMALEHSLKFKTDAYQIARLPEVFTLRDAPIDESLITPLIDKALSQAGEQFKSSRGTEGQILADDIRSKLGEIGE